MKILVAMSGGVDSSVVSHLLKEQGHDLVGVQFKLWMDPLAPPLDQILPSKCCNAQTVARAKKIAEDLDIDLHRIDVSDEFKKEVVDPFLDGYKSGLTPNPCIGCNRNIKFGKLLELAGELGCEKLATGHYARVVRDESCNRYALLEAVDSTKDQSYYLYGLSQEQLGKCLFPLGGMQKSEVYELARQYGVPLPDHYQESQDLCFFPEKEPHDFLDRYIGSNPGRILDKNKQEIGTHKGVHHYTEGQRKGLGIGGLQIPLHVISKDVQSNTITVGTKKEAQRLELSAHSLSWVYTEPERNIAHTFDARINSLGKRYKGTLIHDGFTIHYQFKEPVLGISPGQSIVLYRNTEIVGGGIIR